MMVWSYQFPILATDRKMANPQSHRECRKESRTRALCHVSLRMDRLPADTSARTAGRRWKAMVIKSGV